MSAFPCQCCTEAFDAPQIDELVSIAGLRGGSIVPVRLSAKGMENVRRQDLYDDFTFIVGGCRYRCPPSVAQFLSPRVCRFHSIDATIDEVVIDTDDSGGVFASLLGVARGGSIDVESANRSSFLSICAALQNSEPYGSVFNQPDNKITIETAVDRLQLLSEIGSNISAELEFVSSHFCNFSDRPDAMRGLPVSLICEILCLRSLWLESEDDLYEFIRKSSETDGEFFGLMEFIKFEYCSTDTMSNFFRLLSEHLGDLNVSLWKSLRSRLTLGAVKGTEREFPPSVMKRGNLEVPDGIIASLARMCGWHVHDQGLVEVTSSGVFSNALNPIESTAAKNVADLGVSSRFVSVSRSKKEDIPHGRNNWLCYDFKERRVVPTHYAIRSYDSLGEDSDGAHLKSWLVETSVDGQHWWEVDHREGNYELNGRSLVRTFAVTEHRPCRFIRLVNIGRNHFGSDRLCIDAWEIFGLLIE